ncbi:glutamate--tRNA ligase [Telmatospirillum siberiense]|uniref:Glutamate--tRNA ligase n=1 Tax=Telmatospirillum siberiense TaxID=382514 RepID=A0A2N3PZN1_9PROT|nr:glutamate--tRNA ligase [Telmatospirillum siberiense]PKU25821.1 glutamate--tRNA ligase [Telmatospirillum siberiense]
MTVTVRFAPSPTGRLHVGNARPALINWLFARKQGGRFVLRIDDTDRERSRLDHEVAIGEDLVWLGLTWDERVNQSARTALYEEVAERLKAAGRLYPCFETSEELEYKRKRQMARGVPPVYDRAALKLTEAERKAYEAEGRRPHWRFKLDDGEVRWDDLVRGACHYDVSHLSDPVLIRADGTPLYTLPSVFDDADLGITHVIRGEDHVTNTAAQIQIFLALGATPPQFAHLPLLTDAAGQGFSKRLGSLSLGELRASGVEAMALTSLLAKLGTSDAIQPRQSLDALVAEFDIAKFSRATPKFDPAELDHLNARLLHEMSFADAAPRLKGVGLDGDEAFWMAVRANLTQINDARDWWHICRETVAPVIEDAAFAGQAAGLLPPEPWTADTWKSWTGAVQQATGRKGRELFHPLRLALTGRENGPELKTLLPLIGRTRAAARLCGEAA